MKFFQIYILVIYLCVLVSQAHESIHFVSRRAAAVDPSTIDTSKGNVQSAIVNKFNDVRAKENGVNLLKLSWDGTLAAQAAQNTKQCPNQVHTPEGQRVFRGDPYGQNLALSNGGCESWEGVIDKWVAEKFGNGDKGHYTQVAWAPTFLVGCAVTVCKGSAGTDSCLYACNFFPQGNIVPCQNKPYISGTPCTNAEYCTGADCDSSTKLCNNPCLLPRDSAGNCASIPGVCTSADKDKCQSFCGCKGKVFYKGC